MSFINNSIKKIGRVVLWIWVAILALTAVFGVIVFISDSGSFEKPEFRNTYCDSEGNCDHYLDLEYWVP
jgi:hypothetical protein